MSMIEDDKKTHDTSTIEDNADIAGDVELKTIDARLQQLSQECPPFYRNRNLLKLYLLMIPGCIVPAVTLGFDSSMMNGLQAVPSWDNYFGQPRGPLLGILSAILYLGAAVSTPFISPVGDRFGRRKGIFFAGSIMLIGGVIQGASVNFAMFLVSRFIIGCGIVFANTFAPVLIGELAHPKDRQVITSLYQTFWSWITFATFSIHSEWSWRIPSLLQAAPAIIQMIGVCFLPESPRWLIAKGRVEEARAILIKYHVNGNAEDKFVALEFKEMQAVIQAEVANETGWRTLVATPGNRRRVLLMVMLGLFSQWSGNGLVSYYLVRVLSTVGVTDPRQQNIINGCLNIWNWISAIGAAFLTAHLKRRTQYLISVIGMLAVFAAQSLCAGLFNEHKNTKAGTAVVAMLFLFYPFYNMGFNGLLYCYPVEVLPYPIRAKGFSVLMFFGKAGIFINLLVNPIALAAISWKYYLVYVGWLCIELVCVYLFVVETKGPSLEAIAEKFDKKTLVIHDDKTATVRSEPADVDD